MYACLQSVRNQTNKIHAWGAGLRIWGEPRVRQSIVAKPTMGSSWAQTPPPAAQSDPCRPPVPTEARMPPTPRLRQGTRRGQRPTPSPQRGSKPRAISEISAGHGWWQTPACSGGFCGVSSLPPVSCLSSHKGNTAFWGVEPATQISHSGPPLRMWRSCLSSGCFPDK